MGTMTRERVCWLPVPVWLRVDRQATRIPRPTHTLSFNRFLTLLVLERGNKSVHICRKDLEGYEWGVKKKKEKRKEKKRKESYSYKEKKSTQALYFLSFISQMIP